MTSPSTPEPNSAGAPGIGRALALLTGGRLASNAALRVVFPFLPAISRALGITLDQAGLILGAREVVGLAGPFVGAAVERVPRRRAMLTGLSIVATACALAAGGGVALFGIGVLLIAFGKIVYDSALVAWVADRVPYARRGRALGITELAWAGALTLMPLAGLLIDAFSWRAPFIALAGFNLVLAVALRVGIPEDPGVAGVKLRLGTIPAGTIPVLGVMAALSFAAQLVFLVYGAWLEDAFGLTVAAIGVASVVVGLAELVGSGSTVMVTDRLGKRVAVAVGTAAMIPAGFALALVGNRIVFGLAVLAVLVTAFEFAFVSGFPLISELAPESRAAMVGLSIGVVTAARAIASVLAPQLYGVGGMGLTGAVAAVTAGAALVAVIGFVREPDTATLGA